MPDTILIRTTAPKARVFEKSLLQNGYRCIYLHTNVRKGSLVINPAAKTFKWVANFTDAPSDMTTEEFLDLFL